MSRMKQNVYNIFFKSCLKLKGYKNTDGHTLTFHNRVLRYAFSLVDWDGEPINKHFSVIYFCHFILLLPDQTFFKKQA